MPLLFLIVASDKFCHPVYELIDLAFVTREGAPDADAIPVAIRYFQPSRACVSPLAERSMSRHLDVANSGCDGRLSGSLSS
jgi:hypothetical protein